MNVCNYNILRTLALLILILLLWGCGNDSLEFKIRFDEIAGLKQNDPVYFENNRIGQVNGVTYTAQGNYLVDVTIVPQFRNAATADSKFFIGFNPDEQGSKAVIVLQEVSGGKILEEASVVRGFTPPNYLEQLLNELHKTVGAAESELRLALVQLQKSMEEASQQLNSGLERALGDISTKFQSFKEELNEVPDSREVQQLEESIKRFVEEFNQAQEDVRNHLREEVVPQLRQELEQLRKLLEKEGREDEIEKIERQMDKMIMV
jgi:ABC-type transporter Mla subunit MlaD